MSEIRLDLKKQLKDLYNPSSKEIVVVDVPKINFLMIDGMGNPNTAREYKEAIEALYSVSYTIKFMIKKEKAIDYTVMPIEGLWWADDMTKFRTGEKAAWKWTSMIMQPEYVTTDLFKKALDQTQKKKNLPSLSKLRFQAFHEGLSAQIMHIGSFSSEGPIIERIHAFIKEKGYDLNGKHHEIYLSDPRKAAPEKMKTILRQPIKNPL
ncbi:MAG: hypothetical protein QG670_2291 [Thermoproteota archaeon]|nr:hypothetical protein [Thermoproteota archaeon]